MRVPPLIDAGWPRSYEVEVSTPLPSKVANVLEFRATGRRAAEQGIVLKVRADSFTWIGTFERGDGKLSAIYFTPSPDHLCVVAGGVGYWIPVLDPKRYEVMPIGPIQEVRPLHALALLLFADYTELAAYGAGGQRWITRRVSWDGIEILRADAKGILGRAWDATREAKVGFFVDPETGRVEGGSAPPEPE